MKQYSVHEIWVPFALGTSESSEKPEHLHGLARAFFACKYKEKKDCVVKGSHQALGYMHGPIGGTRGRDHLENHKSIGLLSNNGLDSLENHKAIKPTFNMPTSEMAFHCLANDGPL